MTPFSFESKPNSSALWLIDQLIAQGVRRFCLAPGSRSTPLALAIAEHPNAELSVHYDERGLGFFALGIGKAGQSPGAIITTSGTAVGNLLPCVMEAHHSSTPLIVLTADRPQELRDCGANQTTDQIKIFQSFARWQFDLSSGLSETAVRSLAAQGVFHALQTPAGPVHFNCMFQEPLYQPREETSPGKPIRFHFPRYRAQPYRTERSRGLILVGKLPQPHDILPILQLAQQLRWPVCADILSNARCFLSREQIKYYDWIDKPLPDFVLYFGEKMTSRKMVQWIASFRPEYVHVSPLPFLQDPERIVTERVQSDIAEFCETFQANSDSNWFDEWDDVEPIFQETGCFTEVHAMKRIRSILPEEYGVFLGNGMPIRDADHFLFPERCTGFFGNRGLSGIDGNIATIAGLAETIPILGIIGDQAALHDLNSIPLLKSAKHPAILLISNNFGGGIFHHLPVAASPYFEKLWGAGHEIRFEQAADFFDLPYFRFEQLGEAFANGRSGIVELITDRIANHHYQTHPTCLQKQP